MAHAWTFDECKHGYRDLWQKLMPAAHLVGEVDGAAKRIIAGADRYRAVSEQTGVPWYVVGIIHDLECSCNFTKHLHNGDKLTARTWQEPAGRPRTGKPPFDWAFSACDAIRYDGLDKVEHWSIERIAYELEKYNGWGYRNHPAWGVDSPYLWSYSNLYIRGKYDTDGHYDPTLMSEQPGAMVLLHRLMQLDGEIRPTLETEGAPVWTTTVTPATDDDTPAPAFPSAAGPGAIAGVLQVLPSRRLWGMIIAAVLAVLQFLKDTVDWLIDAAGVTFGGLPAIVGQTQETIGAVELVCGWLKINWQGITGAAAVAVLTCVIVRHVLDEKGKPQVRVVTPGEAK